MLADEGIEFRNSEKAPGGWLPLDAYDDEDLDLKTPQGWLRMKNEEGFIPSKGLWKDRDGLCYWRKLKVTRFFPKSRRYEGFWEHTQQRTKLPRLRILFDCEDPRKFV